MNETLTGFDKWSFVAVSLSGPFMIGFANKSIIGESTHGTQCTVDSDVSSWCVAFKLRKLGFKPVQSFRGGQSALALPESPGICMGVRSGCRGCGTILALRARNNHPRIPTSRCRSPSCLTRTVILPPQPRPIRVSTQTPWTRRCDQPPIPTARKPLRGFTVPELRRRRC